MKKILLIGIIFIILMLVMVLIPNYHKDYVIDNQLYISEILASNNGILLDDDNEYSDYIKIYNNSSSIVSLKNYFLSDDIMGEKKWQFPDIEINPSCEIIVFASGKNKCNLETNVCHTNFKLSKDGEIISLIDNNSKVISKVKYDKLNQNESLIYYGTSYIKKLNKELEFSIDINKTLIINEVSAIGVEAIELYNSTKNDINLLGYTIVDSNDNEMKFPDITIKSKDYLVLYGSDEYSYENSKLYLGFHINNSDEVLYLYNGNSLIDSFHVGKLNNGVSVGINDNQKVFYKDVTMGKKNSNNYYFGYAEPVSFSIDGGYVKKNEKISLSCDGDIYYTLDGSFPTTKSEKYEEDIIISKSTVVKTMCIKEGYIESDVTSRTYFIGREHSLPVISISSEHNGFFSQKNGIFMKGYNAKSSYPYRGANFWQDVERKISFEYYEPDGSLGIDFVGGLKIFGGWSRGEAQKSMAIYLRKEYGKQEINYPFFDEYNTFTRFVLRNGGQDFGYLKLKDAFLQQTVKGQMDIDMQDYKPVVVYINGEYYGIYNIREKIDASYVERHYGYKKNEIDFIERNATVKEGSIDNYNNLLNYVKNNDITDNEVFKYVESQIDIQELINYWVTVTYFDQFDPLNIKFYRPYDGKWRWILYDLDQSFYSYTYRKIKYNLPFSPYAHGNVYYLNTTLMSRLIKNDKFRTLYIETFAYHLKNTFKPERMCQILDKMTKEIEKEMPYHIERWYNESKGVGRYSLSSMNECKNNIKTLKNQLSTRYDVALKTIKQGLNLSSSEYKKYFGDL